MRCLGVLAGVGSLLYEARAAGFEIVGNYETRTPYRTAREMVWDPNFPGVNISEVLDEAYPMIKSPDLVLGHPPCGSHSQLGNSGQPAHLTIEERRTAQAKRHARVGLLPLFVDTVRVLQPRMFALDNLPKILKTVAPETWWREQLPDYRLTFIIMKNWDYGTPQLRQRLWVVGARRPLKRFVFEPMTERLRGPKTAIAAFKGLPWQPWLQNYALGHVHVPPTVMLTGDYRTTIEGFSVELATQLGLGFLSIPPERAWPYRTSRGRIAVKIGRSRLLPYKYSRTITGLPSVHHPLTGWPLTPRERARLMDWPDDFILNGSGKDWDRYTLMRLTLLTGKAVPSAFPRYLIPQLIHHLEK